MRQPRTVLSWLGRPVPLARTVCITAPNQKVILPLRWDGCECTPYNSTGLSSSTTRYVGAWDARQTGTRATPPPPPWQLHAAAQGAEHTRPDGHRRSIRAERALDVNRLRVIRIVEWVVELPLSLRQAYGRPAPVPLRARWPLCGSSGAFVECHPRLFLLRGTLSALIHAACRPHPCGAHFADEGRPHWASRRIIPPAHRILGAAVAFLPAGSPHSRRATAVCSGPDD